MDLFSLHVTSLDQSYFFICHINYMRYNNVFYLPHRLHMDSDVKSSSMETDNMTDSVDFPPIPDITDITLKVETTLIHVNKGVLMVASPRF